MKLRNFALAMALACGLAASASAQERGDITLTFKLDGEAAAPAKITPNKDPEFCGKNPDLIDDTLLVNKDNKGIANIVVSIYVKPGGKAPKPSDAQLAAMKQPVVLDNKGCMFFPHVAVVVTGQEVILRNSDDVGHNTKIDCFKNSALNPIIPAKQEQKETFKAEETLPVKVSCNIHPWMSSWMVIKEHPFVGVSDADGKVTLKDVPAGDHTLLVWHEKSGYLTDVTVKGKKESWKRGRVDVKVKGALDMGEVVVPAAAFKK